MSKDHEVKDIVSQLQKLQLKQATLIARLERVSESENRERIDTAREFVIGDRVRIRNPGVLQPKRGRIVNIGTTRITVQSDSGKKIIRAAKNLILEE
jgi:hypothetical protein